jgi:hypothetical protein
MGVVRELPVAMSCKSWSKPTSLLASAGRLDRPSVVHYASKHRLTRLTSDRVLRIRIVIAIERPRECSRNSLSISCARPMIDGLLATTVWSTPNDEVARSSGGLCAFAVPCVIITCTEGIAPILAT